MKMAVFLDCKLTVI